MYKLRDYQQKSVDLTLDHFRKQKSPGLIVLPTGAGKSLVIAELAKIAIGRVLVLAHVKELVEQNHEKFISYDLEAGIYSAGLGKKEIDQKVIFGSIQSVARAQEDFFENFTLVIIDECHRVSMEGSGQYFQVINHLKKNNPEICILGLTATPYRLGLGWIYEYNFKGALKTKEERFFKKCIYELPLSYMIKNAYLTPPVKIDSPVACYDFSTLKENNSAFSLKDVDSLLKDQKRITPGIIKNIIEMAEETQRQGIMIFTSTVRHAKEIVSYLPSSNSALIVGDTENDERDSIIQSFKNKEIKYLVNVSVLTTGFDASHVDLIAILRPTESVGLYQQIVGRGLRLAPGKKDCIILDYTGQDHNLFSPQIHDKKPSETSVPVEIVCPDCGHKNDFWGVLDEFGEIEEHFGRMCQGALENPNTLLIDPCNYRFRFKRCDKCYSENDIAAKECTSCNNLLVDTDKMLKEAMSLKDAHILRPDTMTLEKTLSKKGEERLEVRYYDFDAEFLSEYFYLDTSAQKKAFYLNFIRMHNKRPEIKFDIKTIDEAIKSHHLFRLPKYIVARKKNKFWQIREKIFL